MSARDALFELAVCGDDRTANDAIDAYRAEVLAEGSSLILAARDADEAEHPDDIAHINRRVGMREAAALLRREFEPQPQPQPSRRPNVRRPQPAGKDTGSAPAGESTQPAPDFFQPGRTYARQHHGDTVLFRVELVATPPDGRSRVAFGWRHFSDEGWTPGDADDMDGWTEVTRGGEPR